MKKLKKLTLCLIMLTCIITGFGLLDVKAATAPDKITMNSKSKLYYFSGSKAYFGSKFYVKQLTDGTYGYCTSNNNRKVPAGKTLYSKGQNNDKGVDYILKNGWPNKTMTGDNLKDFYITQSAIWEYYDQTRGTNNWKGKKFGTTGMEGYVTSLVNGAKAAKNQPELESTIAVNVPNSTMSLNAEKTYFVSSPIKVILTNAKDTYTIQLTNAPVGTILKNTKGEVKNTFNVSEDFVVYVPADSIKNGEQGKVSLKIAATGVTYKTYFYSTGNSAYQEISPVTSYEVTKFIESGEVSLNYSKATTKVIISKQDITSKQEVPGATLEVRNANGEVVDTWVSGSEPHYIEGLEPGDYTLTETLAPAGYILSEETIKFTVRDDGVATNVIMYNTKETKVTKVKISKQDMTTKEELPGATLQIKDKNGKVIDEWVSGSEPHYIEGLEPGDYTLTEKIAPSGYALSEETITFTVKDDGSLTSVTMYNTRYTEVPITDLNVSSMTIVFAAILISLGTGLVVYYGKHAK